MKFLMSSMAYHSHAQNIALALNESGALDAFYTGFVDNYHYPISKKVRYFLKGLLPELDRLLDRRRVNVLPDKLIYKEWFWEMLRAVGARFAVDERIGDWIWERSELSLDRKCACLVRKQEVDAFIGFEHGSLFSIQASKDTGKKSVVVFSSPHHTFREKWVDVEYELFPELLSPSLKRLMALARMRDIRRDHEAGLADIICANSNLVAQSLINAGFAKDKIIAVPPGSPACSGEDLLPPSLSKPVRFIYAGPLSIHKGVHYLLKAWRLLGRTVDAQLHLYGASVLPRAFFTDCPENVFFHGSVSQDDLFKAYQHSGALIFPTLCDGFGLVVTEALAHGLPVITTPNCGAADLIKEGQNGFLVPAGDIQKLASRIEWCIRNPDELLKMRKCALDTARRWAWKDFRNLFREELNKKGLL